LHAALPISQPPRRLTCPPEPPRVTLLFPPLGGTPPVLVHDPFGQAGSGQRQRRFRHRNLTGRPPTARSRTSVSRRPLETARTPHSGHPTTSVVVSTSIHTSPSTSDRKSVV